MVFLALAGCKEDYFPVVDRQMEALVVNGLITNLQESYNIKLTMASAYDSTINNEGILGAQVTIKDELGNVYRMLEDNNRKSYYSDPSQFVAVIGRSYSLHIEMPNGDIYESVPQKMLPPATIDSVHGITTDKEFWYMDILGNIVSKTVYGSETFMDIGFNSDSIYQFRIDNYIINCFSYMYMYTPEMRRAEVPFPPPRSCPGTDCPYLVYGWDRFDMKTNINLSVKTHTLTSNKVSNNEVCFFPFDTATFPVTYVKDSCGFDSQGRTTCITIRQHGGPEGKALQTRLYALNQTSSVYYQQLNKQLSFEGKLFDPIAIQVKGNIKCINDPDKVVLGLFEVSACATRSYWLTFNYGLGKTYCFPIIDLSSLPASGHSKNIPDFWQPF
jgi:hypothetical protein